MLISEYFLLYIHPNLSKHYSNLYQSLHRGLDTRNKTNTATVLSSYLKYWNVKFQEHKNESPQKKVLHKKEQLKNKTKWPRQTSKKKKKIKSHKWNRSTLKIVSNSDVLRLNFAESFSTTIIQQHKKQNSNRSINVSIKNLKGKIL